MAERSRAIWQMIKMPQKTAFFCSLAAGYAVHLYAFTNILPNFDGLSRIYDTQQMTISGRWFLHYASYLNDFTQMPAVVGLLSLLFLGAAAALVTHVLSIHNTVLAGCIGVLMAVFPCVGYTFLYMFTASAYCLAIFLAVLSVWLARRYGVIGWLSGAVVLALSMGIYQAYVTVAISLSLLAVFRIAMNHKSTAGNTLLFGVRMALYLAAGATLYYIILNIFLKVKGLELLSYLGMDAAKNGYPFEQLPKLIVSTYRQAAAFFFRAGTENAFTNNFMVILDIVALLLGIYAFCQYIRKDSLRVWQTVIIIAMLLLLPLGMNFGQILSPYSVPTQIMKYAFVMAYVAVVFLIDVAQEHGGIQVTIGWTALLLIFCLNTNNLLYISSAQAHRATESYATRLAARIENCPGYWEGVEIVIIGAVTERQVAPNLSSFEQIMHYSVPSNTVLVLNKHIYYYLRDWLYFPIEEPSEETKMEVAQSEEFANMPLYPQEGSVQPINGRIVVKLQENYTPKADYEIAYENNRR